MIHCLECRALVVKALGWQSFGRKFEPLFRAFMASSDGPFGVAWGAIPGPMVELIDADFSVSRYYFPAAFFSALILMRVGPYPSPP